MSRVLLGVTGSIAAVKVPELHRALRDAGHEVKVASTEPALTFFEPSALEPDPRDGTLPVRGQSTLYLDRDEWPEDRLFEVGEPVLHIELRKWAQALVVAPLDANTLAKLSLGLCDNLLTCVYRAWAMNRPVLLAPAMNTLMWEHPATVRHLRQVAADFGIDLPAGARPDALCRSINAAGGALRIASPQSKRLACGDEGMGAMAAVPDIVAAVSAALEHR